MNKPWKLVLLLSGIFVTGSVTGALLTARFGRHWVSQRAAPEQWAPVHLRKLSERLGLDDAQVQRLQPIVRRNMEEIGRLRSDCMKDIRVAVERMEREISDQLTPEQRSRFEEYNREKRERMRKFMQKKPGEHRSKEARPDAPPPPPPGTPPREPGT